ncbi:MAG: radical SAM protein, partial [bacterium]|nr:radical SAM protein [bacterium]
MFKVDQLKNSVHVFNSNGVSYIYATYANRIFSLSKKEAKLLNKIFDNNFQDFSKLNSQDTKFLNDLFKLCVVKKNISNFPNLNSLVLLISESCNFACTYCYGSYGTKTRKMCFETAMNAIDLALKLGIRDIVFFGGEPLTNFEVIKKAVDYIEKKDLDSVELRITTNGSLVTEEIAKYFYDHHFLVSVSMDGDEDSHNSTRVFPNGKPTYSSVIKGIELLKKYKVLTLLEITYSKRHTNLKKQIKTALELFPVVSCACVDGKKGCRHDNDVITGNLYASFYSTLLDIEREVGNDKTV